MILSWRLRVAFAAVTMTASAGAAIAGPLAGKSMTVGGLTSQPIGHYDFCKQNNAECNIRIPTSSAPELSGVALATIKAVNTSVNGRIAPAPDKKIFGREEVWTYPSTRGDCEDFALLKRRELAGNGFSLADLLLTVVRKPDGEGHAVLTVRTANGDFVLDNLNSEVRPWNETGYTYIKRQSSSDTGRWVSIESGTDIPVGSVR